MPRSKPSTPLLRLHQTSDGNNDNDEGNIYSRIINPANTENVDTVAVNALLGERVQARGAKDFRRADTILNQLLTRHGVIVNDSDKTWRVGTKRKVKKKIASSKPKVVKEAVGGIGPDAKVRRKNYLLSPDSGPNVSSLSENEIVALLGDRKTAQLDRDYAKADSIRESLKSSGVYVEDGLKEFRYDGVPFQTRRGKLRESKNSLYSSSLSSSRTPRRSWSLVQSEYSHALDDADDMALVNDLLAQRSNARSSGNYAMSDSIRDRLFERYNIRIDDQLGEWSVGGKFFGADDDNTSHWASTKNKQTLLGYKKSEASENLSETEERYIQGKVDERMRAKRTRNYDLSDSIRDELYAKYDVTIHDKEGLWSAGGDFGEEHSWNHVTTPESKTNISSGDHDTVSRRSSSSREDNAPKTPKGEISSGTSGNAMSREELAGLTVVQLKDMLRESRLTVSGTKAKLIDRLLGV